jgi:hypothetical protein
LIEKAEAFLRLAFGVPLFSGTANHGVMGG